MSEEMIQTGKLGSVPKDIDSATKESDLELIFRLQQELNSYIEKKKGVDFNDTEKWINNWVNAIVAEASELRDETNWKWWKAPKELDMEAIQVEVIDLWHFLISLSMTVGLTPETIMKVYEKKRQINFDRQDGEADKDRGYV